MPIAVTCPSCSARMKVADAAAGRKVRCPKCQGAIAVPVAEAAAGFEVVDDAPAAIVKKPVSGTAKAKVAVEDDEDERPRNRGRDESEEDENDDGPRKKKKKRSAGAGRSSMVRNVVVGVVLLILLGVVGYICYDKFVTRGRDTASNANPPNGPQSASPSSIEGTYLTVGSELWGKKSTDEQIAAQSELDRTVKISKDHIQFKLFKRETVRYKIDPSKSPAEFDMVSEDGDKNPGAAYGIYKVEGDILTLFVMGAREPRLRPREFKTVPIKKDGKYDESVFNQVGGYMILTLKKVSNDTTFIPESTPQPEPPKVDEDGPVVAELTKKGFIAEKLYTGPRGVTVKVPENMPLDAIKELNGTPRVRTVIFAHRFRESPPITDEAVRSLNKLDDLTSLEFSSCTKITAAAFRDLGRFPKLTSVSTSYFPVNDAVMEELAKLKALEQVTFLNAKLTDKSLATLATVRTLKSVWLHEADVTASGIKQLNALKDLEVLKLTIIPAAGPTIGELNLPKLKSLDLSSSDVTDEALGKMPVLLALQEIVLTGPLVTDAGLKHIHKQPNLKIVRLLDTKVTKAAVEELNKLKPEILIFY